MRVAVRRCLSALAALTLVAAGLLAVAAPASAAQQGFDCTLYAQDGSIFGSGSTTAWSPNIQAKATPASAAVGATVQVEVSLGQYTNGPIPIPIGEFTPSATVKLGGAQSDSFQVKGASNAAPLQPQAPFEVPVLKGSFTAKTAGDVTMAVAEVAYANPTVNTKCSPTGAVATQASVTVTAAPAAAAPAAAAPAATTTTAAAPLASTGPGDLTRNFLVGLAVFQLGLIVFVRSRRAAAR